MVIKNCLWCKKEFKKPGNYGIGKETWEKRKFCSNKCKGLEQGSRHNNMKDITGLRFNRLVAIKFLYAVGTSYFWLFKCDCGKEKKILSSSVRFGSVQSCGCYHKSLMQLRTKEKNAAWKGDNVGYGGLHEWVKKELGTPDTCEHCGKSGFTGKQIHWANKSQEYKRDLTDWLRLCHPCHEKYDFPTKSAKIKRTKLMNKVKS